MQELEKLYSILELILGESKSGYSDGQTQYQFPCPHCIAKYGQAEASKYNLEVSIDKGVYQCWKCGSEGDDLMHGSIRKLITNFGNEKLYEDYMSTIRSIRDNSLYKLNLECVDSHILDKEELKLPPSFKRLSKDNKNNNSAIKYIQSRGIGWDIIDKYNIGYTSKEVEDKKSSYRIIIPSYDVSGNLNYWVGRDYLPESDKWKRIKYNNPKIEKKNIVFNEKMIKWDADVTLVEGAFDHIVVPNSIPLLGRVLKSDYKLYWDLFEKCNANINIWLDNDIENNGKDIYSILNHGRLHNKLRYINTTLGKDPSEIYSKYGYKGIAKALASSYKLNDFELL